MSVYLGTQKIGRANVLRVDRYSEGYNDAMTGLKAVQANVNGQNVTITDAINSVHNLDVQLTSDTVTNFSGIEVSRYSKNLLDTRSKNVIFSNGTGYQNADVFDDNRIEFTDNTLVGIRVPVKPSHTYTISFIGYRAGTVSFHFRLRQYSVKPTALDGTLTSYDVTNMPTAEVIDATLDLARRYFTFTTSANTTWLTIGFYNANQEAYARELQLEEGSLYTGYESCSAQTSNANAEGIVKGLTSLSPTMNLISNNENVIINVGYYRDTKLALDNQILEIAMSGGN